jgi:hypothetical protein
MAGAIASPVKRRAGESVCKKRGDGRRASPPNRDVRQAWNHVAVGIRADLEAAQPLGVAGSVGEVIFRVPVKARVMPT